MFNGLFNLETYKYIIIFKKNNIIIYNKSKNISFLIAHKTKLYYDRLYCNYIIKYININILKYKTYLAIFFPVTKILK